MKKIFLTLGLFLLTAVSALAFTMPRWSFFPVKVYVPEGERAEVIWEALNDWSTKSGGLISFKPSKSKISANIVFEVVEDADTPGSTDIHAATTYLFKVDVTLADAVDGEQLSKEKFKSAALHETANALALKLIEDKGFITTKDFYSQEVLPDSIEDKDIEVLNKTYRETSIRENIQKRNTTKE